MNTTVAFGHGNLILAEDRLIIQYKKWHRWAMIMALSCWVIVGMVAVLQLIKGDQEYAILGIQAIVGLICGFLLFVYVRNGLMQREILVADITKTSMKEMFGVKNRYYSLSIILKNNQTLTLFHIVEIKDLQTWLVDKNLLAQ